jgi:hypothetical protein
VAVLVLYRRPANPYVTSTNTSNYDPERRYVFTGLNKGNKGIASPSIATSGFIGIPVDHQSIEHRVMQAANFVFNDENRSIVIRVDDFFKAKLMVAHLFRDQPALF